MHIWIYTHGDLDGIASAAVYLKLAREFLKDFKYTINFAEPANFHKVLRSSQSLKEECIIAIMDISLNRDTAQETLKIISEVSGRCGIEWYDHHIWPDGWKENIIKAGVRLYLDQSTCSAGVVAKYAFQGLRDEDMPFFVESVCGSDIWTWSTELSPLLYRVLSADDEWHSDTGKKILIEQFSEGRYWDDRLEEQVLNYMDKELQGYDKALNMAVLKELKGLKVVFLHKKPGPPNSSLISSYLISKMNADIAIIYRDNGTISFRSRERDVNKLAVCMGGGGHKLASGTSIKLNIWMRVLKVLLRPAFNKLLFSSIVSSVERCL